ncbi:MAG: LUD domain-containing protein [Bacilli bacterium]
MSNKEEILKNIRLHTSERVEMPLIALDAIHYSDKVEQFVEVSKSVGGNAVVLREGEDINVLIRSLYPDAGKSASNVPGIDAVINPDDVRTSQELNGISLGIVQGVFGVAENGCVWVVQNVKERSLYFISEYLVILIDKDQLVDNMHEAYKKVQFNDYGFGCFISGPSKTADIEQALVVGAHGAKGVTVILR